MALFVWQNDLQHPRRENRARARVPMPKVLQVPSWAEALQLRPERGPRLELRLARVACSALT